MFVRNEYVSVEFVVYFVETEQGESWVEWYWVAVTGLPVEAIASGLVCMTETCF